MRVHYADDEGWHILEGMLTFRLLNHEVEAPAGTMVFIPAGVAHTYYEAASPTRYLMIMPPNPRDLIVAVHAATPEQHPAEQHPAMMRQFQSEILEEADDSASYERLQEVIINAVIRAEHWTALIIFSYLLLRYVNMNAPKAALIDH